MTPTSNPTAKFTAAGRELDHPVDVLGRARFRAQIDGTSIEFRSDQTAPIGFKGTAILFNKRSWIGSDDYGFWEQIDPAAVTKTLGEADVRMLINHNPDLLLARNKAHTLRLTPGPAGLEVDADMAPVSYARDLAVSLQRGDITQMSFAFTPLQWRYEQAEDGKDLYTVTELRLWDVSVVTYPAYEETDAGLRDAFDALCRSQSLDPETVLRGYAQDGMSAITPPAETTGTPESAPAETTRIEEVRTIEDLPPTELTEATNREVDPSDRMRELRYRTELNHLVRSQ